MARKTANKAALICLCLLLSACGGDSAAQEAGNKALKEQLGLFTSLPIYWSEAGDISAMLDDSGAASGWVRQELEKHATLQPLDTLEADALDGVGRIILAQPRPLSPSENVALDAWVRAGGKALVFADPMLTAHSEFQLGDPRRPQDVVLISPILARWGLELTFDENQSADRRSEDAGGISLPVELPGKLVAGDEGEDASCAIDQGGLVADCRIGNGSVVLVADAALLDGETGSVQSRSALDALRKRAFSN